MVLGQVSGGHIRDGFLITLAACLCMFMPILGSFLIDRSPLGQVAHGTHLASDISYLGPLNHTVLSTSQPLMQAVWNLL